MKKYVMCDLCGDDRSAVLHSDHPHSAGPVVKCMRCGLVYVNPRVKEIQKFQHSQIAQTYLNQLDWKLSVFRDRLQIIDKFADKGKLLDIGCYTGEFLNMAQHDGWDCFGLEPSSFICAYGREKYGVKIYPRFLEDAGFQDNFFDVVTMFHVLEHLNSPSHQLREIHRILKPAGRVVIEVPNVENWIRRLLKRSSWTFNEEHYYHFSFRTLQRLLEKGGFSLLSIRSAANRIHFNRILYRLDNVCKHSLMSTCTNFLRIIGINRLDFRLNLGTSILALAQPLKK